MLPFLFRYDPVNYARWVTEYLADMSVLPPEVLYEFHEGNFDVTRTDRRFNQVSADRSTKWLSATGLYRENAIAIDSEAKYPFGGNVYYVTMQITLPILEFTHDERNLHCDVLHITTERVARLVLDDAIAAIKTSR